MFSALILKVVIFLLLEPWLVLNTSKAETRKSQLKRLIFLEEQQILKLSPRDTESIKTIVIPTMFLIQTNRDIAENLQSALAKLHT